MRLSPQAGMTRAKLAQINRISVGNMSDLLGKVQPDRRAERERKTGRPSLLTLGYVSRRIVQSDEGATKYRIFYISWDKRELVEQLLDAEAAPPQQ